nr:TonB family protein [uncultured Porphyromonas sp.]
MDPQDRSRIQRRALGLVITLVLHGLLLGLLALMILRVERPQPKPVELLVAVNVGNVPQASGAEEPGGVQTPEPQRKEVSAPPVVEPRPQPVQPKVRPKTPPAEPIKTQQHEPSLHAAEVEARKEAERRARAEAEAARRAAAEAAAREAARQQVGRSVAGAFGAQSGKAGSQGTASSGSGNQGSPNGSAGSYALAGRSVVSNGGVLARPATSRAVDGVVRVRIVVDGAGHVTRATVAQGTNIADTSIRNAALAAARATRFNAVAGAEEQEGIITYRFKIQD